MAVPAAPALAQYRSGPSPVYQDELPPAHGADDDRYMYRPQQQGSQGAQGAPSNILPYPEEAGPRPPPPGFVNRDAYDRRQQPAYRADPNAYDRQPPAYQTDPANPYAIRPPAPVGSVPGVMQQPVPPSATAALPPEDQPEQGPPPELPPNLKRQVVDFKTTEPAGTVIIDTDHTYLYLTLGDHKAMRYGIGVGREGFTWSGTERISKMKEWPDWFPPKEMIERQPYLPRMMAGGPGNPLGARALYLGQTLYRIHGTNQPSTIGKTVSSGCIRLLNEDIEDLYSRVKVGTRVVVLASEGPQTAANGAAGGSPSPAPRGSAAATGGLPPLR